MQIAQPKPSMTGQRAQLAAIAFVFLSIVFCTVAEEGWGTKVDPGGTVSILRSKRRIGTITPGLFENGWRQATYRGDRRAPKEGEPYKGTIRSPSGIIVDCSIQAVANELGVSLSYVLTPQKDIRLNSLYVGFDLPIRMMSGRNFEADGRKQLVPAKLGRIHLLSRPLKKLMLNTAAGPLTLQLQNATMVLVQDNRKWGPTLSIRVGPQSHSGQLWRAGSQLALQFSIFTQEVVIEDTTEPDPIDDTPEDVVEPDPNIKVTPAPNGPIVIAEGLHWTPLKVDLDIEAGSALDFSKFGHLDAPAGKHGRLTATASGHFAFAEDPAAKPRRFYGANLAYDASMMEKEQAAKLAERLSRLGYNAVRLHHYEKLLLDPAAEEAVVLSPEAMDTFDYFFAELKKRGIYVALDLYASRPVRARDIWADADEEQVLTPTMFKMLVPVNMRAYGNWRSFTRKLLNHTNPYTKLQYAKDPALAWLSLINEGNVAAHLRKLDKRTTKDWQRTWNQWLAQRYNSNDAIKEAWRTELEGDRDEGTIPLATDVLGNSPRSRDLAVFCGRIETLTYRKMKAYLTQQLGCKALVTNCNGGPELLATHAARANFDYVDEHFYVQHPKFLEKSWKLPSWNNNKSPVAKGAAAGRDCTFTRLLNKPFTVTEYSYAGPGRYRGVGGMLTGAIAALQDWDGIWRYAYSQSKKANFEPQPANYFSLVSDPLSLASERAAMCLFLRGDMKRAPHALAIGLNQARLTTKLQRNLRVAPWWHSLALVTRFGTQFATLPSEVKADLVLRVGGAKAPSGKLLLNAPYARSEHTAQNILDELYRREWLPRNRTELDRNIIESETLQLFIDAPSNTLLLDTPRTAGGFAPAGVNLRGNDVSIRIVQTDATIWVSSIDGKPIRQSKRLLITHLTDLQNTGATYKDVARTLLTDWGKTPHLVRNGSASVTIWMDDAKKAKVWALSTGGKRLEEIQVRARTRSVSIPISVRGKNGARMLYEVVVE